MSEREVEEMAMLLYAEWRLQVEARRLLMGTLPWEQLPYVLQLVWRAVARKALEK